MNHFSPGSTANSGQNRQEGITDAQQDIASETSEKALALARFHHCPPDPKSYEIWYIYSQQSCDLITTRIDDLIAKQSPITPYEIDQLWHEHHSKKLGLNEANRTVCKKLNGEMTAIMQLIQSHLASNDDFSGSLAQTIESITQEPNAKNIRKSIEILVAENNKMRNETADLSDHLRQSKSEIQEMRTNLEISQKNEQEDALTGLANRRCFDLAISSEVANAHRENQPLCLAMIDIDHFKKLNDTYGHLIGDEVLKFMGKLLKDNIKGQDIAARYGGEEFAIILPNTQLEHAQSLAENIREKLENTKLILTKRQQPIGKITASFGIAKIGEYDDTQELIRRADTKLFDAKREGRNRVLCDNFQN